MKNLLPASLFFGFLPLLHSQVPDRPTLVVVMVVDQMRYDYLEKYKTKFGESGFNRLVKDGFSFTNAHYNYMPTYTGPGHASLFTGTTPSVHGIIANDWYSREQSSMLYCTEDKSVKCVGCSGSQGQMSPRNMLMKTVGDHLKTSNEKKSKVIGVALKDRGAILPAGHMGNAAYWNDPQSGNWISSSYYMSRLPDWVQNFNAKNLANAYMQSSWNTLLPIEKYTESIADDNPFELPFMGEKKPVFPHKLPELMKWNGGLSLLRTTPFGNSLTKDFAIEIIKNDSLGSDSSSDLLVISFSATDYIGHRFGPQSIEVQDAYLRLDKDIAELLSFLDDHTGPGNYLVILTADHAAPETPAYLVKKNIPAGTINSENIKKELNSYCKKQFGAMLVQHYINQQAYLDHQKIRELKLDRKLVQTKLIGHLMKRKEIDTVLFSEAAGIENYNDSILIRIQNGYMQSRSGDLLVNYKPFWIEYANTGTDHGSPYYYDTHVPLLWYGWNVKSGISNQRKDITSMAGTLMYMLKIPFPDGAKPSLLKELLMD